MGWPTKKLGMLCEFKNGLWKGKKPPYIHAGVIRNTNFGKNGTLDDSDIAYLDVEFKQFNSRKLIYGDLILEKSGGGPKQPVGRVIAFEKETGDFSFSNFTSIIRIQNPDELYYSYLHKYLHFFYESGATEAMQRQSTGIRNLQLNDYKEINVPLPPLPEQKRIASLLDSAFADIDKVLTNAEQNLKNARELFENYLQRIFSQANDENEIFPLGEIIEFLTDYHANGSYETLKQHVDLKEEEDFAWMVRSTDFEKKFKNDKRYISEHAYHYLTKSKLFGGEIIMSKIGNAGKVYLMPETERPCSLAMNLFLIRLDSTKANNEYVYRYLNSISGKAQITPLLKGAATQTITKDSVRSLSIPLPSLVKQQEKINVLTDMEIKVNALEGLYSKKIKKIEALKISLLHKAFTGQLSASAAKTATNGQAA